MLTRGGSCMQPAVRESTNSRTCPLWRPDFSGEALWKLLSSISSQSARCLWTAQRKVLRTVMKKNSSRPGCLCSPSACLPLSHIFQTAFLNKRELFLPGSQYPESQTVRLSWRFLFLGSLGMPFFFFNICQWLCAHRPECYHHWCPPHVCRHHCYVGFGGLFWSWLWWEWLAHVLFYFIGFGLSRQSFSV